MYLHLAVFLCQMQMKSWSHNFCVMHHQNSSINQVKLIFVFINLMILSKAVRIMHMGPHIMIKQELIHWVCNSSLEFGLM